MNICKCLLYLILMPIAAPDNSIAGVNWAADRDYFHFVFLFIIHQNVSFFEVKMLSSSTFQECSITYGPQIFKRKNQDSAFILTDVKRCYQISMLLSVFQIIGKKTESTSLALLGEINFTLYLICMNFFLPGIRNATDFSVGKISLRSFKQQNKECWKSAIS